MMHSSTPPPIRAGVARARPVSDRSALNRLASLALVLLAVGCGRRLDLPAEPVVPGTPTGQVAYVRQYLWENMPDLTDVVVTRGGILFGIVDSTQVNAYFSDTSVPRVNTSRNIPHPVTIAGQPAQRPVQICEGAGNTLWVAYLLPVATVAQFDIGVSPPALIAAGLVRDGGIVEFGGIAADPDSGFVYVADTFRSMIGKYAPASDGGRRVALLATAGNGDGFVQQPHGLYVFGDSLLVADTGKSWIQVLSADVPRAGRQVAGPAETPLDLRSPLDVWVDRNGFFYVADTGNGRVLKLGKRGEVREVVTELDPGAPASPISLAANTTQVWVPDASTGRMIVYQINTTIEELP